VLQSNIRKQINHLPVTIVVIISSSFELKNRCKRPVCLSPTIEKKNTNRRKMATTGMDKVTVDVPG
jgi:hypothetical protein